MSYIKQIWVDGDIVTAEKMNHMEDGIGDDSNGCFFITISALPNASGYICDQTFLQISQAIDNKQFVIARLTSSDGNAVYYSLEKYDNENKEYKFTGYEFSSYTAPYYIDKITFTISRSNTVSKSVARITVPSA